MPSKILNFLWRVARGVLPTAAELLKKQVDILPYCTWCQLYIEDTTHVLFNYCFARELWDSTGLSFMVFIGVMETAMETIRRFFTTANVKQRMMFSLVCWGLWVRRNKWVWERINMSSFGVKQMALNLLSEWNCAQMDGENHVIGSGARKNS